MKYFYLRIGRNPVMLLLLISPICAQNFTSNFQIDDEGWTTINGANLSWNCRGGNPGGFILGEDSDNDKIWYFLSPRSWSGDWTQYIGGNLSFDIRRINSRDGYNDNFDDIIIINGFNSSPISWPGIDSPWPAEPSMSWTHYEIGLLASNFGLDKNNFSKIMSNISSIQIRGEFDNKNDIEGLDNILISRQLNSSGSIKFDYKNAAHPGFNHRSKNATSGLAGKDGSGDGNSYSNINDSTIRLYCEDSVWGTHSASAKIWDEFVYNSEDHLINGAMTLLSAPIRIQGPSLFGGLFKPLVSPDGSVDIKVFMILRDITDGIDIDKKLLYEKSSGDSTFFDETIDEQASNYIDAKLINNHIYQVMLEAKASSSSEGISSTVVDFSSKQQAFGLSWNYCEVNWI